MNYYQHHIGDYRRDTAHLSLLEHGVYRQLLDWYYLSEEPIPEQTEVVIRRLSARTDDEKKAVQTVLDEFFFRDNGYHHKRCDAEISAYRAKADRARKNGKLGGRPRITEVVNSGITTGNQEQTQAKANHKPLTKNHKPRTINQEPRTDTPLVLTTDSKPETELELDSERGRANARRAHRLPPDFVMPPEWIDDALAIRSDWTSAKAAEVFAAFRDHWTSKPGKDGTKLDWRATWRNWCRRERGTFRGGDPPKLFEERRRELMDANIAEFLGESGVIEGEAEHG